MKNFLCVAMLFCSSCAHGGDHIISRIVDGDTVEIDDTKIIRLVGVDCPESHQSPKLQRDAARLGQSEASIQVLGKEATNFVSALALRKKVRIEYDRRRTDRYSRTLAYLFLEDGTFINEKLIQAGYARAYLKFPFQYYERFEEDEKAARAQRVGIWQHGTSP